MGTKMTGAEALVKCLEREGVEYVFGYSGGAAMPIFDALVDSKIELILTRHEQGATHMADGYARVTGKPGVVLVTSGPGATNTITGILTAQMDSVPMIVLCGQQITSVLGKDAFQETDIFGITMPVVKHSYLIKDAKDIPRVVKEGFIITNSNRPGPVLIDLPKDVTAGEINTDLESEVDLPGYVIKRAVVDHEKVRDAVEIIKHSTKPLLLVGHGAAISKAEAEVKELAENLQSPVTNTLLGKGVFPETHHLSVGMLGMHGTAYANLCLLDCDLIVSIGSRFDDRICGDPENFSKQAKIIHIDIDPAEINKIITPDVSLIGEAKDILREINKHVKPLPTGDWLKTIERNKKRYPLKYSKRGGVKAQQVIEAMYDLTEGNATITTDVGQHQMWAAQFCLTKNPQQWLSSGGAGTMGYGFPAAIGAQFGKPNELVVAIVGDGGFQMTLCELATAQIHKLPLKILVIDNKYLGMVRQWQELFFDNRLSGVDLVGNPDFVKLARSYKVKGYKIKKGSQIKPVLKKALEYNEGPCLIHAEVIKEDNVFPMVPAGRAADAMIIEKPKVKLEKPTGST